MKKLILVVIIGIILVTTGCGFSTGNSGQPTAVATQPVEKIQPTAEPGVGRPTLAAQSERRCGDGVCDGPENANTCPADCGGEMPTQAAPTPVVGQAPANASGELQSGPEANTYWVTNPTSGARLFVQVEHPQGWDGEALPTLVMVPGGNGTTDPMKAKRLSDQGFIVVIFDPDGRGRSEGSEDQDGTIHQDGLAAVIRAIYNLSEVDQENIAIVTNSFGITMGSGVLARYPELPVKFLIDWEGPADRYDTGCRGASPRIQWPTCDNDEAWAQREALTFIAQIKVPYLRVQSEKDHVQPDVSHAVNMINAAILGGVPWVRLNEYPPDQTYDPANPPAMLADTQDKNIDSLIGQYARELFEQF